MRIFDFVVLVTVFAAMVLAVFSGGLILIGIGSVFYCALTGVQDVCCASLLGNI